MMEKIKSRQSLGRTETTARRYCRTNFIIHALVREEMGALQGQQICSQEKSENKGAHETFSPISTEDGARGAHAPLRVKPLGARALFSKVSPNALKSPGNSGEGSCTTAHLERTLKFSLDARELILQQQRNPWPAHTPC